MDEPAELHPLAQAAIDAHETLAPKLAEAKKQHVTDVLHQLEADLAPLIGPIVQRVLDSPDASAELKELLAEAGTPAHQFGSLVVGFAIGAVIGPALGAALDPEIEGIRKAAWEKNPSRVVSPDVAAAGVLKGVFDEATGAGLAAFSGYNQVQFDHLVQAAGQSIGLAEALLLFRRGQIDAARLRAIVQYSNINPKFYDLPVLLQYGPPPAGEVIAGYLKGHRTPAQAAEGLAHAGIDPVNLEWMRASAGRPYGIEQALHLLNRQEIDEARVRQVVAQSDINTDYTDDILKLRHYFPPPRSIVPMLRGHAIDEGQARQLLGYYGVGEPWATAFVKEAQHTSSTTVKELSSSQVTRMYEARLIDRPTANARLTALNYSPADATLLLDFADDARHEQLLQATIRKVGTLYVAHRLSLTDAGAALNQAGVPIAAQHDLFHLWDIQRTATSHVPTPSMVVGAGRRQEITPAEVKLRLNQLGIANADLAIFVADGYPPTHLLEAQAAAHAVVAGLAAWPAASGGPVVAPKRLTVVQIAQLYTAGTIGTAEAHTDLMTLGYTSATATQLISTFTPPKVPKA